MILNAFWSGILAAIVMAIWMEVAGVWRLGALNQLTLLGGLVMGRRASRRFAKLLGVVPHLLLGGILGAIYGWLVESGLVLANFSLMGLLVFAIVPWLIIELAILPVLGQGIFSPSRRLRAVPANFILHGIFSFFLVYFLTLLAA